MNLTEESAVFGCDIDATVTPMIIGMKRACRNWKPVVAVWRTVGFASGSRIAGIDLQNPNLSFEDVRCRNLNRDWRIFGAWV